MYESIPTVSIPPPWANLGHLFHDESQIFFSNARGLPGGLLGGGRMLTAGIDSHIIIVFFWIAIGIFICNILIKSGVHCIISLNREERVCTQIQ